MMLALHGRETEFDAFVYVLAEKLHKTVGEIEQMPHAEYVRWQAYFTAQNAIREAHGG